MDMRKAFLTLALVGLLAVPVAAQFGGGGGLQLDSTALLGQKSIQEDLKLTDDQKKTIQEANEAFQKAVAKAREDMDRDAMRTAGEDRRKAIKKVVDKLDEKQTKRLLQIEVQIASGTVKVIPFGPAMKNPRIFANEAVQKELKLTSKQKDTVKDSLSNLDKDVKEAFSDAQGDFGKAFRKVGELSGETYEKIEKSLDDDQKKTFAKLGGEKFEGKFDFGFGGFGPKKGKDKKKEEKKDEF